MAVIKKTVVDKLNRTVLSEGRTSGIGFAMLKKLDNINFETVNPISPCKDYLAEVIFTENHKVPTSAYGLSYPKQKHILNEDVSYMVFKNVPNKGGVFSVEGKTFEAYSKEVADGHKNIEHFINAFQSLLTGKFVKCKVEAVNDNQFLLTFDTRWARSIYSISLLSLFVRIGKDYQKKTSPLDYIEGIPNKNIDYSLIKTAIKNIKIVINNKKLPDTSKAHIDALSKGAHICPHNDGICAWNGEYSNVK